MCVRGQAKNKDTPLLLAARWGLRNVCEYLMSLSSVFQDALRHTGSAEMTADQVARVWGFDAVADCILEKGS